MRNIGVISALYALPFGKGKSFGSSLGGFANGAVSGWSVNSIVTLQEGFPITPQLSYNPSNNGDTKDPVRPFLNPDFTGPVILGKPGQWFNPNAFIAPPSTSGFYGNLGRDTFAGPGLATWDFSVLKDIPLRERLRLQFRAEIFNLLDRAISILPTSSSLRRPQLPILRGYPARREPSRAHRRLPARCSLD